MSYTNENPSFCDALFAGAHRLFISGIEYEKMPDGTKGITRLLVLDILSHDTFSWFYSCFTRKYFKLRLFLSFNIWLAYTSTRIRFFPNRAHRISRRRHSTRHYSSALFM